MTDITKRDHRTPSPQESEYQRKIEQLERDQQRREIEAKVERRKRDESLFSANRRALRGIGEG